MKEKLDRAKQELAGHFDALFSRIIEGTSINPRRLDLYYEKCRQIVGSIALLGEGVSIEVYKKLAQAVDKGFQRLEEKIESLEKELEQLKREKEK